MARDEDILRLCRETETLRVGAAVAEAAIAEQLEELRHLLAKRSGLREWTAEVRSSDARPARGPRSEASR
jgi:hypothetical protein